MLVRASVSDEQRERTEAENLALLGSQPEALVPVKSQVESGAWLHNIFFEPWRMLPA